MKKILLFYDKEIPYSVEVRVEEFKEDRPDSYDYKGSEPAYIAPFLCNTYFRSGCRSSNRAGITRALRY